MPWSTCYSKDMRKPYISRGDIAIALGGIITAIGLQALTWLGNGDLSYGPHPLLIGTESMLAAMLALTIARPSLLVTSFYRRVSFVILALISIENVASVGLIIERLVSDPQVVGYQLLGTAIAIYLTNMIVFALWYWEIDSPGFSGKRWSRHDQDFLFTQQRPDSQYRDWRPNLLDYLYLSVTNAINLAPADTVPLTRQAKLLMGSQALISITTLALVIARSVNIIGQ